MVSSPRRTTFPTAALLVALAEMAIASGIGAVLEDSSALPAHAFWFGEDQGRYVVTGKNADLIAERAKAAGVPLTRLGATGGKALAIAGERPITVAQLERGVRELAAGVYGRRQTGIVRYRDRRRRAERAVTARRQTRCVCGEAADDTAAAERNTGTERPHFGAANLHDRQRVARAQHRHWSDGRDRGCSRRRRCSGWCRRGRAAAGRAAADRGHGAAARCRQLRLVAFETLQSFGAAGLHACAIGHEIGPARGADGGGLLCSRCRRRGRRRRGGRSTDACRFRQALALPASWPAPFAASAQRAAARAGSDCTAAWQLGERSAALAFRHCRISGLFGAIQEQCDTKVVERAGLLHGLESLVLGFGRGDLNPRWCALDFGGRRRGLGLRRSRGCRRGGRGGLWPASAPRHSRRLGKTAKAWRRFAAGTRTPPCRRAGRRNNSP